MVNPSVLLLAGAVCVSILGCERQIDVRPNVVFIHIDDLGWKDLGYMGSSFYETPNVDKLASDGLVFTNAYAGASNCAPSRACLLTGQNTPRHGVYTVESSERGHAATRRIIPIENADSINLSTRTLAHLFKDAGYTSLAIGKWHLSSNPVNNGFDFNIGGDNRGNPGPGGYFAPYNIDHIEQGPEGEYLTDRLTDEAIDFIHKHKELPFFLYMSYYTVHTPLQGKEYMVEKYRNKEGVPGQNNPVYSAMVESMDENVGRILTTLDALGLKDNTIVVFVSDNGGIRSISYQDPLRAGKGSYYEGGIRVPMIISWPGRILNGVTDEPVVNLDFYPTFLSILELDDEKILDGMDLTPLFDGGSLEDRPLFWHFPIYLQRYNPKLDQARDPLFRTRPGTAMRYGKWKLHEYFEDGVLELYDLEIDPGETNNLADIFPDKKAELHQMMLNWRTQIQAPVPTQKNPDYDPDYERQLIRSVLAN